MLTKDEFVAQWASVSMQDLRSAVRAQGMSLSAKSKAEAVEEAWELYSKANEAAPAVLESPAVVSRESAPAVHGPLLYEARVFGLNNINTRRRAGYVLDRHWQTLQPGPSPEQLLALRADKTFVQLRVKE